MRRRRHGWITRSKPELFSLPPLFADPIFISAFGTPSINPIAGLHQAERVAARESEKKKSVKPAGRTRDEDQLDLHVQTAAADDAVQGLSGNGREETLADRRKQDGYRPQQTKPDDRKPLDLSA